MIGGVDGYKWNITDSYDNNLNQRNNVNNKDELGQKGAVDKSKTTECQTCHKAATQNGEVVSASVRVQTSVCPECGRSYISGGVTDTQIRYYNESNPYQQDLKQTDGIKLRGANVDEIG